MTSSERPSLSSFPPSITDAEIRLQLLRGGLAESPSLGQALELDAFAARAARNDERDVLIVLARALLEVESERLVALHALSLGAAPCLERLLRHAGDDQLIDQTPTPIQGDSPLGMRKFIASRPARATIERFLLDPDPRVIERVLKNPMLKESDVLRILTAPRANASVVRVVARSPWLRRERVRRALILGARVPLSVAAPVLALVGAGDLGEVIASGRLSPHLRQLATEWKEERRALIPTS